MGGLLASSVSGVASRREGYSDSAGCQGGDSCVSSKRNVLALSVSAVGAPPKNMVCWPVAEEPCPLPVFGFELRFSFSALKMLWFSVFPGPGECPFKVLSPSVILLLRHRG